MTNLPVTIDVVDILWLKNKKNKQTNKTNKCEHYDIFISHLFQQQKWILFSFFFEWIFRFLHEIIYEKKAKAKLKKQLVSQRLKYKKLNIIFILVAATCLTEVD